MDVPLPAYEKLIPPIRHWQFACGSWIKTAKIPDYQSSWAASFDTAGLKTMEKARGLLLSDDGEPGRFYRACLNESHINALGAKPLWDTGLLDMIAGVKDQKSLTDFLVELSLRDKTALFNWWVGGDDERPDEHMVSISGGSLSLPDRNYYLDDSPTFQQHRAAFLQAITEMFALLKAPTGTDPDAVMRVETAMATATVERSIERKVHPTYIFTQNLTSWFPSIDWGRFLDRLGLAVGGETEGPNTRRLSVYSPSYLIDLQASLTANITFSDLRNYLTWKVVKLYSPYLPASFSDIMVKLNSDLYGISHK